MSSEATSSKVTLTSTNTPAQQCTTCGYKWPWVVFNTDPLHQNHPLQNNVCVRCQSPELEQWRWHVLRGGMKKLVKEQRQEYRETRAMEGHPPLVKAAMRATGADPVVRLPKRSRESGSQPSLSRPLEGSSASSVAVQALLKTQASARALLEAQQAAEIATSRSQVGSRSSHKPNPPTIRNKPVDPPPLPPEYQYLIPQDLSARPLVMPSSLRAVPEPTRAILWLQMHYTAAPLSLALPQIQIFTSYKAAFPSPTAADPTFTEPQMHGADLIKLIPKVFRSARLSGRGYVVEGLQLRKFVDPALAGALLQHINSAGAQSHPQRGVTRQPQHAPAPATTSNGPPISNGNGISPQPPAQPGPSQIKRIRLEAAPFPMLAENRNTRPSSRPITSSAHSVPQRRPSDLETPPAPYIPPRSVASEPISSIPPHTSQPLPAPSTRPEQPSQLDQPLVETPTSSQNSTSNTGIAVLSSLRKKLIDLSGKSSSTAGGPRPLADSPKATTPTPKVAPKPWSRSTPVEIISLVDSDDEDETTPMQASAPTPSAPTRAARPSWATVNQVSESPRVAVSEPESQSSRITVISQGATTTLPTSTGGAAAPGSSAPVATTVDTVAGPEDLGSVQASAPRSQTRSQWDSPPPADPISQPVVESLQATELDSEDEVGATLELGTDGGAEAWWDEIEVDEPR